VNWTHSVFVHQVDQNLKTHAGYCEGCFQWRIAKAADTAIVNKVSAT
jgi:hypothetical protein